VRKTARFDEVKSERREKIVIIRPAGKPADG